MSKNRGWLWLTALLVLFMLGSYFILSKDPQEYLSYDTHSPSPTGLKAFYTYLDNETNAVNRWNESPELLPKGDNQLLIMVEPYTVPNEKIMADYISFLENGNTILLLMGNPNSMFGLNTEYIENPPSEATMELTNQTGTEFEAQINSPIRLSAENDDQILLVDSEGTIALTRSFGKGSLIVFNTPQWMTNEFIVKEDHLSLILSILREEVQHREVILFDEFSHGDQYNVTILSTYPQWFLLIMLQGILLSLLFLWKRGKRFGPILSPREEYVRFSDESLRALAAWHIRGKRYQDSLVIQADYVKYMLQERWGISVKKAWIDRADQLDRKLKNKNLEEIRAFLKELSTVLAKENVSKQEYLEWSKKLDQLRKEVEEG